MKNDLCVTVTVLWGSVFICLPLPETFVFSYAFVLLSSVLLFQLEGLPLVILGGRSSDDEASLCLSGKVFISPWFLKDNSARCSILGWHFFLWVLRTGHPTLLSYNVSAENDKDMLWQFSCTWQGAFLLLPSGFCFCLWILTVWISCVSVWPLWVPLSWGLLSFLNLGVHFHLQIREVLSHYFFK